MDNDRWCAVWHLGHSHLAMVALAVVLIGGCKAPVSAVGNCPRRSAEGNEQFEKLRKHYPEHARDDLRIQQYCKELR